MNSVSASPAASGSGAVRIGEVEAERVRRGFEDPVRGVGRPADGGDIDALRGENVCDDGILRLREVRRVVGAAQDRDIGDPAALHRDGDLDRPAQSRPGSGIDAVRKAPVRFGRSPRFGGIAVP